MLEGNENTPCHSYEGKRTCCIQEINLVSTINNLLLFGEN